MMLFSQIQKFKLSEIGSIRKSIKTIKIDDKIIISILLLSNLLITSLETKESNNQLAPIINGTPSNFMPRESPYL